MRSWALLYSETGRSGAGLGAVFLPELPVRSGVSTAEEFSAQGRTRDAGSIVCPLAETATAAAIPQTAPPPAPLAGEPLMGGSALPSCLALAEAERSGRPQGSPLQTSQNNAVGATLVVARVGRGRKPWVRRGPLSHAARASSPCKGSHESEE